MTQTNSFALRAARLVAPGSKKWKWQVDDGKIVGDKVIMNSTFVLDAEKGRAPGATSFVSVLIKSPRMVVLALNRQAGIDPILFSFGVVADVRVIHGRQFTGSLLRRVSTGLRAIDDNIRILVRQKRRS